MLGCNAMSRKVFGSLERAEREILPLPLALYHAVNKYPGGAAAIAATVGRNPTTLQHKLSPTATGHTVNVDELAEILSLTRDPRAMDSLCDAFGDAAWVDLRELLQGFEGDQTLAGVLAAVGDTLQRQSALTRSIAQHLADDGHIDKQELAECKLHLRRTQGALLALERMLELDAGGHLHG